MTLEYLINYANFPVLPQYITCLSLLIDWFAEMNENWGLFGMELNVSFIVEQLSAIFVHRTFNP